MHARTAPLLIPLLAVVLAAQASPRETFERARLLEESNTRLTEALALYAQVAAQSPDRQLAGTAQLRIGLLHERLGRKEDALRAFQRVVDHHADQQDAVRQARARLELASRAGEAGPRAMQVWKGENVAPLGGPSPDGALLSYVDFPSGNLAIRTLATGASRAALA